MTLLCRTGSSGSRRVKKSSVLHSVPTSKFPRRQHFGSLTRVEVGHVLHFAVVISSRVLYHKLRDQFEPMKL